MPSHAFTASRGHYRDLGTQVWAPDTTVMVQFQLCCAHVSKTFTCVRLRRHHHHQSSAWVAAGRPRPSHLGFINASHSRVRWRVVQVCSTTSGRPQLPSPQAPRSPGPRLPLAAPASHSEPPTTPYSTGTPCNCSSLGQDSLEDKTALRPSFCVPLLRSMSSVLRMACM